jgi:PAS domain S-box-containing protein
MRDNVGKLVLQLARPIISMGRQTDGIDRTLTDPHMNQKAPAGEGEVKPLRDNESCMQARTEPQLSHLLEAAPDAILEVDRDGRIVRMNTATERLFGYTREELAGENVDRLVPDEVRARHAHHRENYSAHPLTRPMGSGLLLQGQRKDGSRFPVEISLSPFKSEKGFRIGAIIRDVTERVQAEEQIRALQFRYTQELTAANRQLEIRNREVEAANQLKSEFLASMSHELRTPLHTIIGFAELLSEGLEGPLSEKQSRFVNHILTDGRHLLELINDILDLSKIESGRLELKLEDFDWTQALGEVLATVQPQAGARGITIGAVDVAPQLLHADRVRFKEILYNLLSNAVKFTLPGGRVWVESTLHTDTLALTVNDTGVGIPEDQQTRIFDKFYQAGTTTRGVREGTGLGLSITKHLVERHGGTIHVRSAFGRGSSFTVRLPLERREVQNPPQPENDRRAAPLVLIVEADPATSELLVSYLEPQGYRTAVAVTAEEALVKATELRPDAITLDLLIPGSDGWNILHELRRGRETAAIPVLVVSIIDDAKAVFTAGAAAYLMKPVDREILVKTLRQHIESKPGNPPKVLVVDDEPASLQLLQEILGGSGYVPILNSSGREALETLAKTKVSAVIVDLMMPGMNGFEFILRIKEDLRLLDLPLLVLTGKELTGEEFDALQRDTKAVFLKGTTWREDLVFQLRSLLNVSAPTVTDR